MSEFDYRAFLLDAEQKVGEGFDRTLITLSGGALGLSTTFIKEIVGPYAPENIWLIQGAWILWAISLISILVAYYFGQWAYRKSVDQLDKGKLSGANPEMPGGVLTPFIHVLNAVGGLSFLIGAGLFVCFSIINFSVRFCDVG